MDVISFRTDSGQQKVTKDQILVAMKEFDQRYRTIEEDAGTRYAVNNDGKRYPPKRTLELATGAPRGTFCGGKPTNDVFERLGFKVDNFYPQFTTISPTHIVGKKEYAWQHFLSGGYAAIGWLENTDLTGKNLEDIEKLLAASIEPDGLGHVTRMFERFLSLEEGDYIAVPNVNYGLFGVGIVRSGYKFKENIHDTGDQDRGGFYSHYRDVEWVVTAYHEQSEILLEGEKRWQPFGTIGKIQSKVPAYIARLVGLSGTAPLQPAKADLLQPEFLKPLIARVQVLRTDSGHQERDHESLVEDFFVNLGYARQSDLRFRRGRIDLTIASDGLQLAIVEVKREWDLEFESAAQHIKQAYQYAHECGIRYVLVTNGDDYLLFDRLKGLSWESNLLGEWSLTALREEDLKLIERLRPESLRKTDLPELFQHLSESFVK